jgi:hypothetical protein
MSQVGPRKAKTGRGIWQQSVDGDGAVFTAFMLRIFSAFCPVKESCRLFAVWTFKEGLTEDLRLLVFLYLSL